MVTLGQVILNRTLHVDGCSRQIGARGARREAVRVVTLDASSVKMSVQNPAAFEVTARAPGRRPFALTENTARLYHAPSDCPLMKTSGPVDSTITDAVS